MGAVAAQLGRPRRLEVSLGEGPRVHRVDPARARSIERALVDEQRLEPGARALERRRGPGRTGAYDDHIPALRAGEAHHRGPHPTPGVPMQSWLARGPKRRLH
jgi:hypothetical protein